MRVVFVFFWLAACNSSHTSTGSDNSSGTTGSTGSTSQGTTGITGTTGTPDTTPPSIVSVAPSGTLAAQQTIVVTFSEPVLPSTLTGLDGTLGVLVGSLVFCAGNTMLAITPSAGGWSNGASQTLVFRSEIQDLSGNVMPGTTLTFNVDAIAPTFVSVAPSGGSLIDWSTPITITWSEALGGAVATSGTLAASGATPQIATSTLTLTPASHWAPDSGETLAVTVHDAAGNPSAELDLTFDVVDGAFYVHPSGASGNVGTRSKPKATIEQGLSASQAFYSSGAVRVAAGTYTPTVFGITVPTGFVLSGGYDPSNWNTPPSRTLYETLIDGTLTMYTVTLSPSTRLERFKVQTATSVSGTCSAVELLANPTGLIEIVDNELLVRACSEAAGVRSTAALGPLTVQGNLIGNAPGGGENDGIQLNLGGGSTANVLIDGNTIEPGTPLSVSSGILIGDNGVPASGTFTISNNNIFGGGATSTSNGTSYGLQLTSRSQTYVITGNRIHGGTAQTATYGIYVSGPSITTTIAGNAIHGGAPQLDGKTATGIYVVDTTSIWNNLITGGGRVDASITQGESIGIITFASSGSIFNNTIHYGFLSRGACIQLNSASNSVANNILFSTGFLAGSYISAVAELVSSANPVALLDNVVYGFGSGDAFVYQNSVASGGTCPGFAVYSCYSSAANLNDSTITSGGGATSSTGNVVGDPGFVDIDGADNDMQTLFDSLGAIENDWQLANTSTVKTMGLNGATGFGDFGFDTDFLGVMRTAVGATGWSPGAYENDD